MQVVPWLDEVLVPRFERAVFRIGDGVPAEVVDLFNRTELPVRSVDERYRAASHLQVVMGGFEDWFSSAVNGHVEVPVCGHQKSPPPDVRITASSVAHLLSFALPSSGTSRRL